MSKARAACTVFDPMSRIKYLPPVATACADERRPDVHRLGCGEAGRPPNNRRRRLAPREVAKGCTEADERTAEGPRVCAADLKARLKGKPWVRSTVILISYPKRSGGQHDITRFAASADLNCTRDRAVLEDPAAALRALKAPEVEMLICHEGPYRIRWKAFRRRRLCCNQHGDKARDSQVHL